MKRIVTPMALAYVLGVLLAYYVELSRTMLVMMLIASVFIYMMSKGNNLLIPVLFVSGMLAMTIMEDSSQLTYYDDRSVELQCTVLDDYPKSSDHARYLVSVEKLAEKRVNEKAMLLIKDGFQHRIGETLRLKAEIRAVYPQGNPGLFSYQKYLRARGVFVTIRCDESDLISAKQSEIRSLNIRRVVKEYIIDTCDSSLSPEASEFMKSVILGKTELSTDRIEGMRSVGLSHILAVSGLHIGIIVLFLCSVLIRVGVHRNLAYLFSIIIIALYIHVIDYRSSALRAGLMIGISMLAHVVHQPYDPKRALSISAIVILLINPLRIFDLGLILSFLAMGAIIYLYPRFSLFDTAEFTVLTAFKLTFVIQLAMLPVIIYYFNRVGLMVFLANPVIVPIFGIALSMATVMLCLGLISSTLAGVAGVVVTMLVRSINILVSAMEIPMLEFRLPSPDLSQIAFYYLVLAVILNRRRIWNLGSRVSRQFVNAIGLYVITIGLFGLIMNPAYVNIIDIGQGDAALIRSGTSSLLIDTGGGLRADDRSYEYTLKPYIEKTVFGRLDGVLISHNDADHSGNLIKLYEDGLVKHIYTSDQNIAGLYPNSVMLKTGDVMKLGSSYLQIVTKGLSGATGSNDSSVVAKFVHGKFSVLFTGDVETAGETAILNRNISSTVMKVPHHGSSSSSTERFIEVTNPAVAIISVGRGNSYGHPVPEIVKRYTDRGISVYRTDYNGNISILSDNFGYSIRPGINNRLTVSEFISYTLPAALIIYITTGMLFNHFKKIEIEERIGGIE